VVTNLWGWTSPGARIQDATIAYTDNAWLCAHLWEHYEYQPNRQYLQDVYPTMKGAAEFFLDVLIPEPKYGWLVTAPSVSPENFFFLPGTRRYTLVCHGPTHDSQLIRELFGNVITASEILDVDTDFRNRLKAAMAKLPPNRIGSDGRLMEWLEEYEEADPHHHHFAHLYGLHPGNQITLRGTPDLAAAARKSLEARGDGGTGLSRAWKISLWARLGDGNRAYSLLRHLLKPTRETKMIWEKGGTYPNFLCACPPFQIEGNFGGCAGIAEMLLQTHSGVIELLPALPDVMSDGSFNGMRVRGGAEISASWADKKLTSVSLKATADNTFKLRVPDDAKVSFTKGNEPFTPVVTNGVAEFTVKNGETVKVTKPNTSD